MSEIGTWNYVNNIISWYICWTQGYNHEGSTSLEKKIGLCLYRKKLYQNLFEL